MIVFNKILMVCCAVVILAGCSSNKTEMPEVVQVKRVIPYHTVSEGDTVGSVATKYGMTRSDLIKINGLVPPYQLYNGQRLVITVKADNNITAADEVTVSEAVDGISNPVIAPQATQSGMMGEIAEQPVSEVATTSQDEGVGIATDNETIDDLSGEEVAVAQASEYIWPVSGGKSRISQHFDDADAEGGIILDSSAGTPVKAIADGTVVVSGVPSGEAAAYGVTVVIKHPGKKSMSIYANLKESNVKVHQAVKQGAIIGKVGKSGTIAKKPQLYFEINDLSGKGRKSVDPEKLLPN